MTSPAFRLPNGQTNCTHYHIGTKETDEGNLIKRIDQRLERLELNDQNMEKLRKDKLNSEKKCALLK